MDIDDVHMEQGTWQDVPFRLKDGGELPFDVRTEVFYVESGDLDQPLSGGQTSLHKKVAVTVRAQGAIHANRYPDGFVRLERVFSYSQDRARNRYFDAYPAGTALDELDSDE